MGTLSHTHGKPQGYRGKPGTCRWCGCRLPRSEGPDGGYRDNGVFCSLRCGFQWAVRQFGVTYQ
jgi:hypothetical protein